MNRICWKSALVLNLGEGLDCIIRYDYKMGAFLLNHSDARVLFVSFNLIISVYSMQLMCVKNVLLCTCRQKHYKISMKN